MPPPMFFVTDPGAPGMDDPGLYSGMYDEEEYYTYYLPECPVPCDGRLRACGDHEGIYARITHDLTHGAAGGGPMGGGCGLFDPYTLEAAFENGISRNLENGRHFGYPITWNTLVHYGLLPHFQEGGGRSRGGGSRRGGSRRGGSRRGGSRGGGSRHGGSRHGGSNAGGSQHGSRSAGGHRSSAGSVASWGDSSRTPSSGSRRGGHRGHGRRGRDPMDDIAEEMETMSMGGGRSHRSSHRSHGWY